MALFLKQITATFFKAGICITKIPIRNKCSENLLAFYAKDNYKIASNRWLSRMHNRKSWFLGRKKGIKYDIVSLGEVGPFREVPDHIPFPDYALTGVPEEQESEIEVHNASQIEHMKQSCALAKIVLDEVSKHIKVGITTDELDAVAHATCIGYGAYPSPLNYRGYPKSICTSVNNIACHGIPDNRQLKNGDIVSVDVSVFYHGYHGDCAATYAVGEVDPQGRNLIEVASLCLEEAIKICHPGQCFYEIGKTINDITRRYECEVVPAFCGHGIGSYFHGQPSILHYENEDDRLMKEGMTFTIEPVVCEGRPDIIVMEDGWTAATDDGSRCAQFEHTVLITKSGSEILTVPSAFRPSQK